MELLVKALHSQRHCVGSYFAKNASLSDARDLVFKLAYKDVKIKYCRIFIKDDVSRKWLILEEHRLESGKVKHLHTMSEVI